MMKRRTPPRADETAFASRRTSEKLRTPTRKTRGLNQNGRRPGRERRFTRNSPNIGADRAPGQTGRPKNSGRQKRSRFSPKRRGADKECRNAARSRRPAPSERPRPPGKSACASFLRTCRPRRASGRASGGFRRPAPCPRTARKLCFFPASRKGRRGGFDAVAQRPRGREAFPQAEHGSKTGKEQQKGLPSPGQSRKRKALFMFMRKR